MYYDLLIILGFLITVIAQIIVKTTYNKYQQIDNKKLLTGAEVARKILNVNGLDNIYVVETKGDLTDHYDPMSKVIRLSTKIYNGETIASAAVAAHEVGHAIQHKNNYTFMKIRSFIFPLANIGSKFGYFVIIIGLLFGILNLAYFGLILLGFILLFQLVTLPVEFNASKMAMENIEKTKILSKSEQEFGKKVLTAAAFTYVASLLTTVLQALRLFLIIGNRRD